MTTWVGSAVGNTTAVTCAWWVAQWPVLVVGLLAAAAFLFGISALYHRRSWGPTGYAVMSRFDHANIFALIAGSYTPFGVLALHGTSRIVVCTIVWAGCAAGAATLDAGTAREWGLVDELST